MRVFRPLALVALLLGVGSATAAPITVTNGESFMFAAGEGNANYVFKSTYGDLGPYTPGSFNLAGDSSGVNFFGDGGVASAAGAHTSSNTGITITGSTAASSGQNGGFYVGQIASDDAGIVDTAFTFGYYLEFTLDAVTNLLLTLDGTASLNGEGEANFGGILFDENFNQVLTIGDGGSGSFSEQFTLGAGTYFLFAQTQSYVTGSGPASASTEFTLSLQVVEPIPEPISLVAFGGLLAFGGLAARRMRRA